MFKTIKTLIAVAALSSTVSANVQAEEVTVQKGDTLWALSRVHNASVENIKKWNHLSTDVIHPGDVLTIASEKQYTVKQGDTLWKIAKDNQVSVQALMEWNKLYTNLIHPGLNLVIYDDSKTPGDMEPVNQEESKSTDTQVNTSVGPQTSESPQQIEKSSSPTPITPAPQQETAPKTENNAAQAPALTPAQSNGSKEITVKATAYTASCAGCSGITRTGINLKANPDAKVISVDPSVIPLGSKVYIEGYGVAIAADTGGAIKGNRIDVYMRNQSDALQFGAKQLTVKILN